MSQTTAESCDLALGQQQTIAERNEEVDLSSIASPMAGIEQVVSGYQQMIGERREAGVSSTASPMAGIKQVMD